MQNLWKTYDDITGILRKRKICGKNLLSEVEYFKLKITDNKSDDFQRMLSKNDLPFY